MKLKSKEYCNNVKKSCEINEEMQIHPKNLVGNKTRILPKKPAFCPIKPGFFNKTQVGWVLLKNPGFLPTLQGSGP